MDFPKGLCWLNAGPGPLQAGPAEARDPVSALRGELDFSDTQAVRAAHRDLQALAPTLFPHGVP